MAKGKGLGFLLALLLSGCATINVNIGPPTVFDKGKMPQEFRQFTQKPKKDSLFLCITNVYDKSITDRENLFEGYVESVKPGLIENQAALRYYFFEVHSIKDSLGEPEDVDDERVLLRHYLKVHGLGYELKK